MDSNKDLNVPVNLKAQVLSRARAMEFDEMEFDQLYNDEYDDTYDDLNEGPPAADGTLDDFPNRKSSPVFYGIL